MSVRRDEPTITVGDPAGPYDEMAAPVGDVRPHYAALDARISTLTPDELAERQKTQERFFLLQGITFTVYGAESSTERIIPTDILPRIIPAAEWARIEAGLTQRLRALNMFLADIYSEQKILMDGVVPRELVLQAPSYPPGDAESLRAAQGLRQRLRLGPDPPAERRVRGAGGQPARPVRRLLHAGQPRGLQAGVPGHVPRRRRASDRPLSRSVADDAQGHGGGLAARTRRSRC